MYVPQLDFHYIFVTPFADRHSRIRLQYLSITDIGEHRMLVIMYPVGIFSILYYASILYVCIQENLKYF